MGLGREVTTISFYANTTYQVYDNCTSGATLLVVSSPLWLWWHTGSNHVNYARQLLYQFRDEDLTTLLLGPSDPVELAKLLDSRSCSV